MDRAGKGRDFSSMESSWPPLTATETCGAADVNVIDDLHWALCRLSGMSSSRRRSMGLRHDAPPRPAIWRRRGSGKLMRIKLGEALELGPARAT